MRTERVDLYLCTQATTARTREENRAATDHFPASTTIVNASNYSGSRLAISQHIFWTCKIRRCGIYHNSNKLPPIIMLRDFPISSTVSRAALLVFFSWRFSKTTLDTLIYIDKFIAHARDAIKTGTIMDLLAGTYMMAMYNCYDAEEVEPALVQSVQFSYCVKAVLSGVGPLSKELAWIVPRWISALSSAYMRHFQKYSSSYCQLRYFGEWYRGLRVGDLDYAQLRISLDKLLEALDLNLVLFETGGYADVSPSRWLVCLLIYMQIYFERFLYQVTCPAAERSIKEQSLSRAAIKNVIDQVISQIILIPGMAEYLDNVYQLGHCIDPNYHGPVELGAFLLFPNIASHDETVGAHYRLFAASIYCSAHILSALLDINFDDKNKLYEHASRSALALCRVCAAYGSINKLNVDIIYRSLFWAGMVLNRADFAEGIESP